MAYHIIDNHTGNIVGKAKTRRSADQMVDRRDNAYGGYRHSSREIPESATSAATGEANSLTAAVDHCNKSECH